MIKYLFLNNFANTRGYQWIPADMKKIGEYPHNGYPTNMDTGTKHIFIQRIRYEELLPVPYPPVDIPNLNNSLNSKKITLDQPVVG